LALSQQLVKGAFLCFVPYINGNLKFYVMEKYTNKHPILNTILSVINVSLEVILALIALGFIIGLYGILN
jgi:ABC-type dipeptide/oligopeptide/nickel transport system permease component